MKRVVVLLLLSFFIAGCVGGDKSSPAEEGLAEKASMLQGQINSKEQFYSNLKLAPTLDYDLLAVYGGEPTADKGGVVINSIAILVYASDSGEEYASSVWKLRTGGRIWAKDEFKELESREIEGTTAYVDTRGGPSGDVEVKWLEGGYMYSVGKRTGAADESSAKEELVALAEEVISSGKKLDPDAPENEWMLLYQYLPDPLEGEHLFSVKVSKLDYTSIQGDYGDDENQFSVTIVPGEEFAALGASEAEGLSSSAEVNVGEKTATAGYKSGKYKIVYVDEENQVYIATTLEKGDAAAIKESMAKTLEATIAETAS